MIASVEEFLELMNAGSATSDRITADSAPESVWLDLVENHSSSHHYLVRNKTLPVSILSLLSDSEDEDIRWWVACKRKAGPVILAKLSFDVSDSVRERVAYNAKTPDSVLQRLAMDKCPFVANKARERLMLTP